MEARSYTSTFEESAVVERVARIVSSVRGTKPDYTRLAAELEQAIPFDVFGVVLLRHDREAVRVVVCRRESGSWRAFKHQLPREESKLECVLQSPRLLIGDYPEGLDGPPAVSGDALSGYHQLRSTLIVPLAVEESVLGTLELGSTVSHIYADQTLQRLVSAVARVLASAIESAQLGGSDEIHNRQRQVLKDVSSALTSKMDLSTILHQIVNGIAKALNVASLIVMQDRYRRFFRIEAQSGLDQAALEQVFRQQIPVSEQCIIGQTLQRRQPFVSHDIVTDERFPDSSAFFTIFGVHSVFCYPLVTGTTVYGALLLCSTEPGGFTPLKADILSLFANQATVAIHNGMLLESAHQRSRFQEAIERLERGLKQRTAASPQHDLSTAEHEEDAKNEYILLARVREETQRTFGVSFSSLLHFISDHLLTQGERDLQAIFSAGQDEQRVEASIKPLDDVSLHFTSPELAPSSQEGPEPLADTLSLLTQTAEAALMRTGMLGELSQLLIQLKQSTDGVRDAWFVVDPDGSCVYMNPAAEALCDMRLEGLNAYSPKLLAQSPGQTASTTLEHAFMKLLPRIRNAEEVTLYLQDFTQGNVYRQELRCVLASEPLYTRSALQRSANGHSPLTLENASSDYHYQFIRYPLYNQQGQLSAHALQVRDVTEQVRDEKNRSALLSSVSHDLRTPLTTIKAAVTGLLQTNVAWDERDRLAMLEDIDAETDHLTVLVNALVELSRIEMGALVLEKEWCDVAEVVYGTVSKMERALAGRPVRTFFQHRLPLIYVDHVQLERVFYNLLENAISNSPEQAEIIVNVGVVGDPQKMLRVQIIDQGSGIPERERERIFKSFYSLRSYGNGLGLAICKGIIEAHQGRIGVETAADGGSCFVFTLPVHPYAAAQVGLETFPFAESETAEESGASSMKGTAARESLGRGEL